MKDFSDIDKMMPQLRQEYHSQELNEKDVVENPIEQFGDWFEAAIDAKCANVNAMALATVSKEGQPSSRIVLLKGFNEEGFVFYGGAQSQKARELNENPKASLLFFWPESERQVRVAGSVCKLSREKTKAHFQGRPFLASVAALVFPQSTVISGRAEIDQRFEKLQKEYYQKEVPLPDHWDGFCLKPILMEFWQGREHRLNDRLRYRRDDFSMPWQLERLSP